MADARPCNHLLTLVTPRRLANILRRIPQGHTAECWLWTGAVRDRKRPYGQVVISGRKYPAHRIAYLFFKGSIPDGLYVCHSCDAPRCCNPDHLWLGTHDDNMADRLSKGRQAQGASHGRATKPDCVARGDANGSRVHPERLKRGERVHGAKLTADDVRRIRETLRHGRLRTWSKRRGTLDPKGQQAIAEAYGVKQSTISSIVRRRTWRHI